MRRMPGSVYTLPVPAILYLSAIKYKNDPRSLAIKAIKVSLMTTMRSILLPMPDLIMMSWNLWIPNIYQSTQVLSVTFIISANSHYSFIFLETIRSDSFISTSNLL